MSQTVYYKKNDDGTFEAVSMYDSQLMDAIRLGSSVLITVNKNFTSRTYNIDPDFIALSAAAEHLKNQLSSIIHDVLCGKPAPTDKKQPTPRQQELFDQLKAAGICQYWFPSYQEVAEKFLQAIVDAAKPATQVPWVQETAEQYRAAMILAMKEN